MRNDNKGFSLIELIVVIAIMAILVGALAPQFIKYVERSRQSTDLQNVTQIKTAVEAGVASGEVTADVTLTFTTTTVTLDDTTKAAVGTATGLVLPANLKSAGWTAKTYKYSTTTYKWTESDGGAIADYENTKDPKFKMSDVFK